MMGIETYKNVITIVAILECRGELSTILRGSITILPMGLLSGRVGGGLGAVGDGNRSVLEASSSGAGR